VPEQLDMFAPPARAVAPAIPSSLRALTLWQPWAHAVAHFGKRIENRPWAPWTSIIGQTIAIHAAAKPADDEEARVVAKLREMGFAIPGVLPRGAIIATVRVTGFVRASDSPWFFGPYGWVLDDVRTLATPVPCRGMQGLWPVPDDVALRVLSMTTR